MTSTFHLDAIQRLSQLGPPQTIADGVALAAVGVASAAYMLNGIVWNKPDPYHDVWFRRMESRSGVGGGGKATRNIAKKLEESVSIANQKTQRDSVFASQAIPLLLFTNSPLSRTRMSSSFGVPNPVLQRHSQAAWLRNVI